MRRRRGLLGAAVRGGGELSQMLARFRLTDLVVMQDASWSGGTSLSFCYRTGGNYYMALQFEETPIPPILDRVILRRAIIGVNQDAAGVSYSGTWGNNVSNANAYGGNYKQGSNAGSYVQYTTPAAQWIGGWCISGSNTGLMLVTIDGDNTLANLLPTAQQAVDAGELANTVLVANGGTLNPTDRVWDTSAFYLAYPTSYLFADTLSNEAHTIRLTVTGYKNVGSSGATVLFAGFAYGNASTHPLDTNGWLMRVGGQTNLTQDARNEISHLAKPTGATHYGWVGHTADTYWSWVRDSLTVYVDGAEQVMAAGTRYAATQSIQLVSATHWRHTEYDGGGTDVATGTLTLTLSIDGLQVDLPLTWATAGDVQYGYSAMFYCQNFSTIWDRARLIGDAHDYDLSNDDDAVYGGLQQQMAIAWENGGHWAGMAYVPDPSYSLFNWAFTTGDKVWIKDNIGGFQKWYWNSPGGAKNYAAAEVWPVRTRYAWIYLDDADVLARGL